MELVSTIENSAFCAWVRESSSIFGYYGFLFLHVAGLALAVGMSVVVNFRVMGLLGSLPLRPLQSYFPVMWVGFWINALSGSVLLASDATAKLRNPIFGIKMVFVAGAVIGTVAVRRIVFRRLPVDGAVPPAGRWLAAASLLLWFGATAIGRVMAFTSGGSL
jgi:hypothetical protein